MLTAEFILCVKHEAFRIFRLLFSVFRMAKVRKSPKELIEKRMWCGFQLPGKDLPGSFQHCSRENGNSLCFPGRAGRNQFFGFFG